MRIRNRNLDTSPIAWGPFTVDHYYPPTTLISSGPHSAGGTVRLSQGAEDIEDSDTPNRAKVNEVTHTRHLTTRNSIGITDDTYGPTNNRWVYTGPEAHWFSWTEYGKLLPTDITVSWPQTEQELVRRAQHKFYNENEVDNLLNLVEAPKLVPSLRSLLQSLKKRKIGSTLSKGLLTHSFAIAPLVSDMLEMRASMPKIRNGFKRAHQQAQRLTTVRSKSAGKLTVTPTATGYTSNPSVLGGGWWTLLPSSEATNPTSIVTLVGIRDRPRYFSPTLQAFDRFLRTYVSGGPASFLWERLPYSFMVDWFVNTSSVIDKLNESLTGLNSQVIRLSYSQKYEYIADIQKVPTSTWTSTSDWTITGRNIVKYYHRKTSDPQSLGKSGRFGKKQLALTGALLHEIVAKLKAR